MCEADVTNENRSIPLLSVGRMSRSGSASIAAIAARARAWKVGDGLIIDGLGPDGISARVLDLTRGAVRLQSGYVYHYAFAMLIGVITGTYSSIFVAAPVLVDLAKDKPLGKADEVKVAPKAKTAKA